MDSKNIRRAAKQGKAGAAKVGTAGRQLLANPQVRGNLSDANVTKLERLVDAADIAATGDDATKTAVLLERARSGALDSRTARAALELPRTPKAVRDACRRLLAVRGELT